MIGIVKKKRTHYKSGIILDTEGREWHYRDTIRDPDCNRRGTIVSFRADSSENIAANVCTSSYTTPDERDTLAALLDQ